MLHRSIILKQQRRPVISECSLLLVLLIEAGRSVSCVLLPRRKHSFTLDKQVLSHRVEKSERFIADFSRP